MVMTGWKAEGSGCLGAPLTLDKGCVLVGVCANTCTGIYLGVCVGEWAGPLSKPWISSPT